VVPRVTKQPTTPLGREISTLRRRANLSQRGLGALADLSWTYLQFIELGERAGKRVHPTPNILRRIATGLAKDSVDGTIDQDRANEIYERLMATAGYVDTASDDLPSERDLDRYLAETLGPRDGKRLAEIIKLLPALGQQDRKAAINSLENVVDVALRSDSGPDLVVQGEDGTTHVVEVKTARRRKSAPKTAATE